MLGLTLIEHCLSHEQGQSVYWLGKVGNVSGIFFSPVKVSLKFSWENYWSQLSSAMVKMFLWHLQMTFDSFSPASTVILLLRLINANRFSFSTVFTSQPLRCLQLPINFRFHPGYSSVRVRDYQLAPVLDRNY